MIKKRLLALSVAAAFLLTACQVEIVPKIDPVSSGSSTSSVSETKAPSNTTPSTVSEESGVTAATVSEITEPEMTEPVTPEVIPATFTEEQLNSGYLYLSGGDQFEVSKNKNIITIVLDAADTQYVTKLLKNNPSAFKSLKDFTLYTNTCSVFDSTFQSFTQIYSGMEALPIHKVAPWNEEAWGSEKAKGFYERFHKAGYKMNFYVDANWELRHLIGKADNVAWSEEPLNGRDFYFVNYGFNEQISTMKLAEDEYNRFNVYHLWGAHTPTDKDTFTEQMEYLFGIVNNFTDKLKELGVYDSSTIIIMGDHGSHDLYNYPNSTPLFMIKEAGKTNEKIKATSAPIYFADLMSTYLINAGIYNEATDRELYGSSIYDFNEKSVRERTANYRYFDGSYPYSGISPLCPSYGYNVIRSYKYTGNSLDLLKVINDREYEINWMEEDAA